VKQQNITDEILDMAKRRWEDIDEATVRIIPTDALKICVIDPVLGDEIIVCDWLNAGGGAMMGYGPKQNILVVQRWVVNSIIEDGLPEIYRE